MQIGLIVNPIAGIGGRVGLKGSDGVMTQREARRLGGTPQAPLRAAQALAALVPLAGKFELLAGIGKMGETIAREAGFDPLVVGMQHHGPSSASDTIQIARDMRLEGAKLLLFAGGDGTARDIYNAVGPELPVLGIPAGVKIYSAVFGTNARAAGEVAAAVVRGRFVRTRKAEVIDLDEDAYRSGQVSTRLYGYLTVPYQAGRVQNKKAPTPASEAVRAEAIAADVVETMQPGWQYIIGPGSTTRAIAERLGFPKTLVGVDVYTRERVIDLDVGEDRLLELVAQGPTKIIITPIGGQGFLFGRGNQQVGPRVIQAVGRENIIVVSLAEKIFALNGQPLLVDTGDAQVDELLAGHLRVITGYHDQIIYRVAS